MTSLLMVLVLVQSGECRDEVVRATREAASLAERFDLAGAASAYERAAGLGCTDALVGARYVRGLLAAREAYSVGGSPESLEPVREAIAWLETRAMEGDVPAAIAGAVLQAAAAAAQSERDEMSLYLDHVVEMEARQWSAGEPGAPVLSAAEAAGLLWLQVHRYDDARRAYLRAREARGPTPYVRVGLARVAAGTKDVPGACAEYGGLVEWWGSRAAVPPEVVEARTYRREAECEPGVSGAQGPPGP